MLDFINKFMPFTKMKPSKFVHIILYAIIHIGDKMKKKKILNSAIGQKEKNNEILITSIIISFGINIFSTGVLGFLNIEKHYGLLIVTGSVFSIVVLFIYLFFRIKAENTTATIRGLIIHDNDSNKIINIPEYTFSNYAVHYLSSAFSENKALARKWRTGEIGITDNIKILDRNNNSMIIELIEYIFITRLSTDLVDYYNMDDMYDSDIEALCFDKMPRLLRENRFLRLFSEDMNNRPAFSSKNVKTDIKQEGRIVYATGKKGAIFNRFELLLPKEVKIKKNNFNTLEFDMKYFTLKVEYIFEGYNAVVDPEFYEKYLKLEYDPIRYNDLDFKIKLDIIFKNKFLFTNKKIENYMWIDKLLNNLMEVADIETFYNKINWESNKCIIRCLDSVQKETKKENYI